MKEERTESYYTEAEKELDFGFVVQRIKEIVVQNWKWFAASIVVCSILGFLYLSKQPRVYQRDMVLMIEETGGSNGSKNSSLNALLALNGVEVGDNIKNEIYILGSYRLMKKVVKVLRLNEVYTVRKGLKNVSLYKNKPVEVEFLSPLKGAYTFHIVPLSSSEYVLKNLKTSDGERAFEQKCRFGDIVQTPAGKLRINRTVRAGKYLNEDITVGHYSIEQMANAYRARLSINGLEKEASLINLSFKDTDTQRAEDVLTTLVEIYKQDIIEGKNRIAKNTEKFIDARIKDIGGDLFLLESSVAAFKKANKLVDMNKDVDVIITEESMVRRAGAELQTQIDVLKVIQSHLNNSSGEGALIPVFSGLGNSSIQNQIANYNELVVKRNNLLENAGEESFVIQELNRSIHSLRGAIQTSVKNFLQTAHVQLSRSQSTEGSIRSFLSSLPEKEQEAIDIKRNQAIKEGLFVYLLNKREEVILQQSINEANIRIVEDPMGSPSPVSPRRLVILVVSLLVGAFIPSAFFYLKCLLETSVRGRKDIEDALTIPVLGEIPHYEAGNNSEQKTLITQDNGVVAEAFRILRYGLSFMKEDRKVLMVTSTTPAQGKSFVSRNLAMMIGATGKRVLLIDADIRKHTQSSLFGKTKKGLTLLLCDESVDVNELIIRKTIGENVDFLPAGVCPPDPAELLMSSKLEELVATLRQMYDYIVFDTTPAVQLADASIVNRVADATLYVIRVGVEDRRFLPRLEKLYQENRFRNPYIVINDCVNNSYGYGYSYEYYGSQKTRKHQLLPSLLRSSKC